MRNDLSDFVTTIGGGILVISGLALLITTDIIPQTITTISALPLPFWFIIGATMVICGLVGRS